MPFEIANISCENPEAAAHTRIGWFARCRNNPRAFAVQSWSGELANRYPNGTQKEMLARADRLARIRSTWPR